MSNQAETREEWIARVVSEAPPLTDAQLVLLRSIMFPARESSARSKPSAYELEQRRLARERSDALAAAKKLAESLTECDACGLQPAAHFYQRGYAGFHDWEPGRAQKIMGQ